MRREHRDGAARAQPEGGGATAREGPARKREIQPCAKMRRAGAGRAGGNEKRRMNPMSSGDRGPCAKRWAAGTGGRRDAGLAGGKQKAADGPHVQRRARDPAGRQRIGCVRLTVRAWVRLRLEQLRNIWVGHERSQGCRFGPARGPCGRSMTGRAAVNAPAITRSTATVRPRVDWTLRL